MSIILDIIFVACLSFLMWFVLSSISVAVSQPITYRTRILPNGTTYTMQIIQSVGVNNNCVFQITIDGNALNTTQWAPIIIAYNSHKWFQSTYVRRC